MRKTLMVADKLHLSQLTDQSIGANPQVCVVRNKETKLIGEIEIGLVVRSRGKQDALAFVLPDIFLNGTIAFAVAVTEIMAFINNQQAEAAQSGQCIYNLTDRKHPGA